MEIKILRNREESPRITDMMKILTATISLILEKCKHYEREFFCNNILGNLRVCGICTCIQSKKGKN